MKEVMGGFKMKEVIRVRVQVPSGYKWVHDTRGS